MRAVSTDPSTVLAIEQINIHPTDQVVILHSTDPVLVLEIAKRAAAVAVYDQTLTTLNRIRQQAEARHVSNITVCEEVFPVGEDRFDIAVLVVPKGRDYSRGLMYAARKTLKENGRLYIVGPTDGGAKTLIADAAVLFGSSATLSFKKRNRVGVAVQPDTLAEYPADWGTDPTEMRKVKIGTHKFYTMPGVFSWDHLDEGSALLLEHLTIEPGENVLDVGCGYGVLGLELTLRAAGHVTMVDENLLAVACARVNSEGIPNVEVLAGDAYAPVEGRTFDLIVSNPPFHEKFDVNTNVAHRIIREAINYLTPGGRLIIVANAFLKYADVMNEHLDRVRELFNNGRYVILEGRRPERGSVKPVKGISKRRNEMDEATAFRKQGVIPTVSEEDIAGETGDEELDALFAELETLEAEADTEDDFDEADFEEADFDDEDFDDEDADEDDEDFDEEPAPKPPRRNQGGKRKPR